MGRPISDNPKIHKVTVRLDNSTNELLNQCCDSLNKSKAEIIRIGLNYVKKSLLEK